ncbi:hypothetical protein ACH41H_06000 [Streptomyces sp. NPDC020800]|uniref:hypothetical protein n=1 Tax=Streptomyces sp. NPDC020800 TaxID=3365092 RepID=UPI0037A9DEAC
MKDDAEQQHPAHTANTGYAAGQSATAYPTALTHEDTGTRRRAKERADTRRAVSRCTEQDRARTSVRPGEESARHPAHVTARPAPALTGLRRAAEDGSAAEGDGSVAKGDGRRFLGRSAGGHRMLADRRSA